MRVSSLSRALTPLDDVRALVQHHRLGAHGHRGIGHLAPRRQALLDQLLEHLRRPDHRDVRRLAQPHQLFLHLGQALEADLDREIAARDHHRHGLPAGGGDDDRRQCGDRARGLDLGHERHVPPVGRPDRRHCRLQAFDVGGVLHEAEADEVGKCQHMRQVRQSFSLSAGMASAVSGKLRPFSALGFQPRWLTRVTLSMTPSAWTCSTTASTLPSSMKTRWPSAR
jgi:hypothetical protein